MMSLPSSDELKVQWKQHVGAARITWAQISEEELVKSEGRLERLAGLVQERYGVPRKDAEMQVRIFLEKHNSKNHS